MKKVAFILSHPIQYHSPLFKRMSKEKDIDLTIYYCEDYGLSTSKERFNPSIGKRAAWDLPLLNGYNYKFLKNNSWKPSVFKGFFGLMNFGINRELSRDHDLLIVNGWNYFSYIFSIIVAYIRGIKVYVRGDNTFQSELEINGFTKFLKKILLEHCLFKLVDGFLYAGESNKRFYKSYGVPDGRLIFAPHSVDNERFNNEYESTKDNRIQLRKELGLSDDDIAILYVGKLISIKCPIDLIKAFRLASNTNKKLIFVGIGPLKAELQTYVDKHQISGVRFEGFKNQKELCKYYSSCDVFVLPSFSETWGLVVNEAMNFEMPLLLSDHVGCSLNLLRNGENGYTYKRGDVKDLKNKLDILMEDPEKLKKMGYESGLIVKDYNYDIITNSIMKSIR